MLKINFKKFFLYSGIVIFVFILDRISKIYILNLLETNNQVDIYIFSFLKLYLIWNKGIAFGLFSFEQNSFYNFITILIIIINLVIIIMIIKSKDINLHLGKAINGGGTWSTIAGKRQKNIQYPTREDWNKLQELFGKFDIEYDDYVYM